MAAAEAAKTEHGIIVQAVSYTHLYELVRKGKTQTGIVGCSSIDDYMNGVVKKHEPVSYTHLDVYKRQVWDSRSVRVLTVWNVPRNFSGKVWKLRSLDVYKRQVQRLFWT